jgi:histidine triad (HIT) family protein
MAEKKENCEFCSIVEGNYPYIIYQDKKITAFLAPKPTAPGHIMLIPNDHYPILENVPDFIVGHLFTIANKLSSSVFESLGMQGTNIIVNNGLAAGQKHAHFTVHIVPRRQNDNLMLQWNPKQLKEEEMSTVELKLKEATKNIGQFEGEKQPAKKIDKKVDKIKEDKEKDNYLIKQLNRIP